MRINLPEYYNSKVDEDPMEFINESYRVIEVLGIPLEGKVKLVANQIKSVAKFYMINGSTKEVRSGPSRMGRVERCILW